MPDTLRVTVRCFSHVRNVLGVETVALELAPGATTAEVEARIRAMAGGRLAELPWRVALNRGFVTRTAPLADGDEVALIPPVQGG
jgi:molybdopterin converting factor small subunit